MSGPTFMSFDDFKQKIPSYTPLGTAAACYNVYVETLVNSGVDFKLSEKPFVPSPCYVADVTHLSAQKSGYCYLYMFKERDMPRVKAALGAYPTVTQLLSLPIRQYNSRALPHLRLSSTGNGTYHIGVQGTWPLLSALAGFLRYHYVSEKAKKLFGDHDPVDVGFTLQSKVGTTLIDAYNNRTLEFEYGVNVVTKLGIGSRCLVESAAHNYGGVAVLTTDKTFVTVDSSEDDGLLPKVLIDNVNDVVTALLTHHVCTVCHQYGELLTHSATCATVSNAVAVRVNELPRIEQYDIDVGDVIVRARTSVVDRDGADTLIRIFARWWSVCGYTYQVNSAVGDVDRFDWPNLPSLYYGSFRDAFLRCLSRWADTGSMQVALATTVLPRGLLRSNFADGILLDSAHVSPNLMQLVHLPGVKVSKYLAADQSYVGIESLESLDGHDLANYYSNGSFRINIPLMFLDLCKLNVAIDLNL